MAPTLTSYSIKDKGVTERVIENLLQIEGIYTEGSDIELYVIVDADRGTTSTVTVVGLEINTPTNIELREYVSLGLHKLDGEIAPISYYARLGGYVSKGPFSSNIFSK